MMLQEHAQVNETLGLWDLNGPSLVIWYHIFSGTREHQNGKKHIVLEALWRNTSCRMFKRLWNP